MLRLLKSIRDYETEEDLEIIITENLIKGSGYLSEISDHAIKKIINDKAKSFAANHNQAFQKVKGEYFCILNSDVVFIEGIFNTLIGRIEQNDADIVAPLIVDSSNRVQDSFRSLPNPLELVARRIQPSDLQLHKQYSELIYPDWIAGVFLLMKCNIYARIGGFDERYRMYFEDVDFGCRSKLLGYSLMCDSSISVQHDAQRASEKKLLYLFYHLSSALRFFTSPTYRHARKTRQI